MEALFSLPAGHDSDGEESEPDLFQCGKCKQMFTSLQKYLKHKAAKDCSVHLQGSRTVVSPVTNGEVLSGEGLDESTSFLPCKSWERGWGLRVNRYQFFQINPIRVLYLPISGFFRYRYRYFDVIIQDSPVMLSPTVFSFYCFAPFTSRYNRYITIY